MWRSRSMHYQVQKTALRSGARRTALRLDAALFSLDSDGRLFEPSTTTCRGAAGTGFLHKATTTQALCTLHFAQTQKPCSCACVCNRHTRLVRQPCVHMALPRSAFLYKSFAILLSVALRRHLLCCVRTLCCRPSVLDPLFPSTRGNYCP